MPILVLLLLLASTALAANYDSYTLVDWTRKDAQDHVQRGLDTTWCSTDPSPPLCRANIILESELVLEIARSSGLTEEDALGGIHLPSLANCQVYSRCLDPDTVVWVTFPQTSQVEVRCVDSETAAPVNSGFQLTIECQGHEFYD